MEVESVREALNHAIVNFKNSKEFKEKILEGGFASYCVGCEDGWDAVRKLYLNLDLNSIIPPILEDGVAEDKATSIEDAASIPEVSAPTAPEDVPIVDAAPKQGDGGDDWWSV